MESTFVTHYNSFAVLNPHTKHGLECISTKEQWNTKGTPHV